MLKGLNATQAISVIEEIDAEEQMRTELATATVAELRNVFKALTNAAPMKQLKKNEIIEVIVYHITDERERESKVRNIESLCYEGQIEALKTEENWFVIGEVIERYTLADMKLIALLADIEPDEIFSYIKIRYSEEDAYRKVLRDYFTIKRSA